MTGKSDKVKGKMLKLIKNDFLASARVIPLFYLIEIAALCAFFIGKYTEKTKILTAGVIISLLVSFLLVFVSLFFVIYDYQKSLFGQQGYLSFTLPVNSKQLLGSKVIVYGAWMVFSFVNFVLVLDILAKYIQKQYGETIDTASSLLSVFANFPSKAQIITYAVYYILEFFTIILSCTIIVYFGIALSHIRQFQKANVIWAVIISAGTMILGLVCIYYLEKFFGVYLVLGNDKSFTFDFGDPHSPGMQLTLMPYLFMVLQDLGLFFATAHIMHKRINIS
ncbi:MAG: hypothetical protein IJM02_00990 [Clostridia bacterium]|nr:hypothetical protein [Clostridia bacterium]